MRVLPILGFPAYRIWEDGRIETNWRRAFYYPGMPAPDKWTIRILNQQEDGYWAICLCSGAGGKYRRTHLHRLLAETFISPPPFPGACVRHLDGDSTNNELSNLAWGTYKENEDDKLRHGTYNKRISNGKLTKDSMKQIRQWVKEGRTQKEIAKELGVSRPTITRFLNGSTWK